MLTGLARCLYRWLGGAECRCTRVRSRAQGPVCQRRTAVPYLCSAVSAATGFPAAALSCLFNHGLQDAGPLSVSRPWRNEQGFTGLLPSKGRAWAAKQCTEGNEAGWERDGRWAGKGDRALRPHMHGNKWGPMGPHLVSTDGIHKKE